MEMIKSDLVLFCCILNYGEGSKALKLSKQLGAMGGTVFLGKGTVRTEWLNILGILDVRKEVFVTLIDKKLEPIFYDEAYVRFNLDKPHKGIAFSIPLKYCLAPNDYDCQSTPKKEDVIDVKYESIFVIVNKGLAPDVLEAAECAGSTGGTVIHGRGSGTQEKAKLFNIEIEPEKDIILILSQKQKTQDIVDSIARRLEIDKPNAGVVFVIEVTKTLGLYRD